MQYISHYNSPLGKILISSNEHALTGLWFEGQKYFARNLNCPLEEKDLPIFALTQKWLDIYFSGKEPDFKVPVHFTGTSFQKEVWTLLMDIPYGKTVTYGDIAKRIALSCGVQSMSAQAVGGAVGRNPISIIVACHRVIGADGSLTGYAGGSERKKALLALECKKAEA